MDAATKIQIPANKTWLIWLVTGLILLALFTAAKAYRSGILSFSARPTELTRVAPASPQPPPTAIVIPRINLNLPITQAKVTDGTWEVSATGASHWDTSANPGEPGNMVIYGHNQTNLFGPIRWLEIGDLIEVTNSKGQIYTYKVDQTVIVPPTDLTYILPTTTETLTLYTCTGFLDSRRHLVIAHPIAD